MTRLGLGARLIGAAVLVSLFAAPGAGAQEPANGFEITLEGSGTIARDGEYGYAEPGYDQQGTVSTDGTYTFRGATTMDVYFPTAGTNRATANFPPDSAGTSFSGQIQATETFSNSNGASENSSCSAPYSAEQQRIFALAYRPASGTDIELLVAPAVYANRDPSGISCDDAYGVDQLLFGTQASFDGQSIEPDPVQEAYKRVRLTQSQLSRDSFAIPLTFTSAGTRSWAQDEPPPDSYCDTSVYANNSGSCTWNHTWTGTLRFERTCSSAEGGQVQFSSSYIGRDGVERFYANGFCLGGGAGDNCVVPEVVGKTVKKAKRKLKRASCTLGKVKKVSSAKRDKGLIVKQKPKPKTVKPVGAAVDVKVGKG